MRFAPALARATLARSHRGAGDRRRRRQHRRDRRATAGARRGASRPPRPGPYTGGRPRLCAAGWPGARAPPGRAVSRGRPRRLRGTGLQTSRAPPGSRCAGSRRLLSDRPTARLSGEPDRLALLRGVRAGVQPLGERPSRRTQRPLRGSHIATHRARTHRRPLQPQLRRALPRGPGLWPALPTGRPGGLFRPDVAGLAPL